ncbi:MAG TPA: glycosyltransferase [Gemmataceae bacterium]|nr:glycosyltransferase [Gemmataceae bacterium]
MANHRPTICQLLHTLQVGGAEVLAARLARQLGDRFRFVFVCLDELGELGRELRDEGFPVHLLGRRPGVDWRCVLRLAALLRRERVDLLQPHQYTPFFYAITARLFYRRPAVLFTEHGRHQPDYPRRKRMIANRLLLERRDRVVGVGEAVRQALIVNEGIPPGRVQVIYNGIDLSAFRNGYHDRPAVRREMGVGEGDLVLLQVARLDYLKDHATAVRTIERVVRCRPDARLVLVGEGPEREAIERLVRAKGLEAHVRLLGLRSDIGRLLAAADVFLLTSISEGIPLTVIEAMAAGLPVVATRVGGMTEVVEEGVTALLAPAGDDVGLAEAILRLADKPALRRRMGQLGRERAGARFSESRMHAHYQRLYQEMLHG